MIFIEKTKKNIVAGGYCTLLFFLCSGLLIFSYIFLTVHNTQQMYSVRQLNILTSWNEQGFFKLGGLRIVRNVDSDKNIKVKTSIPQTFLYSAFILQKIYFCITGEYSKLILALHNQAIIWVGGALLALLAFRLSREYSIEHKLCLVLGLCIQGTYQTFPWNLVQVYRLFPTVCFLIFLFPFIVIVHKELVDNNRTQYLCVLKSLFVFLMVYYDFVYGFFVIISYFFIFGLARKKYLQNQNNVIIIISALAAFLLFKFQVLYVKFRFPDITTYGSHYMYRSGLDGSVVYFKDYWDLFRRASYFPQYMTNLGNPRPLSDWMCMLGAGFLVYFALMYSKLFSKDENPGNLIVVLSFLIVAYILFCFTLGQAAITHPFVYDIYLFTPILIALYIGVPVFFSSSRVDNNIVVGFMVVIAYTYSMVQLREYAVSFPIPLNFMLLKLPF